MKTNQRAALIITTMARANNTQHAVRGKRRIKVIISVDFNGPVTGEARRGAVNKQACSNYAGLIYFAIATMIDRKDPRTAAQEAFAHAQKWDDLPLDKSVLWRKRHKPQLYR